MRKQDMLAPDNPFHSHSPLYHNVRPAYPAHVVDIIRGLTPAGAGTIRVADIGAGTGKLSCMLAQAGMSVDAVEPSETMRHHMPHHPAIRPIPATAEHTTLPAGSVDVATYAQSWHWMDAEAAAAEAARITTPSGAIVIVWNQMDVSVPWVHRLTRIMRSGDVHRVDQPPRVGPLWEAPTVTRIDWVDAVSPESLQELGTTRSSYLGQDEAGRARMRDNLRWYLYEHLHYAPGQHIDLPYMTLVWTARKRS